MKEEKLKQVLHYAQSLGLTPEEVLKYFDAHIKADETSVFSQNSNVENKTLLPCSGMFCYEDNSFSFELRNDKTVKGIVVYVEGTRFLAVCLEEKRLPWSTVALKVELNHKELDGAKATRNILAAVKDSHSKAEAAEWCYTFAQNGVKSGEAFLPSTYELIKLSDNKERVNNALKKLNLVGLSGWYWSANEKDEDTAILVRLSDARESVFSKRHIGGFVRPVVWVNL